MANLPDILTEQSKWTWTTIRDGLDEELVLHEETLTEMNLLHVALRGQDQVHAYQESKEREAQLGADWEWVFYDRNGAAIFGLIQAKRLDTGRMAYGGLGHRVGTNRQVDLLIAAGEREGYYPLYVFFNWWPNGGRAPGVPEVNGCMVASAYDIRGLIDVGRTSLEDVLPCCSSWVSILTLSPNAGYVPQAAAFLAALDETAPPDLSKPRPVPQAMREDGAGGAPTRPLGLAPRLLVFGGSDSEG